MTTVFNETINELLNEFRNPYDLLISDIRNKLIDVIKNEALSFVGVNVGDEHLICFVDDSNIDYIKIVDHGDAHTNTSITVLIVDSVDIGGEFFSDENGNERTVYVYLDEQSVRCLTTKPKNDSQRVEFEKINSKLFYTIRHELQHSSEQNELFSFINIINSNKGNISESKNTLDDLINSKLYKTVENYLLKSEIPDKDVLKFKQQLRGMVDNQNEISAILAASKLEANYERTDIFKNIENRIKSTFIKNDKTQKTLDVLKNFDDAKDLFNEVLNILKPLYFNFIVIRYPNLKNRFKNTKND